MRSFAFFDKFDFSFLIRYNFIRGTHRPRRVSGLTAIALLLCRRCTVKRRSPAILRVRIGGVCIALVELFLREAIHITSTFLIVLGALGSIASIVSLVLYWCDKKK